MCFFNSAEKACLEQREPVTTLKTACSRKYSFLKRTQLSQENNELGAAASKMDDFFMERFLYFFNSAELGILEKMSFSTLGNYDFQEVFLSKNNST
jgi:hypothetical protein